MKTIALYFLWVLFWLIVIVAFTFGLSKLWNIPFDEALLSAVAGFLVVALARQDALK